MKMYGEVCVRFLVLGTSLRYGQLHVPAALPPGIELPVPIE
jgi:hypothetical protein